MADERFRELVERHFRFLVERGFRRVREDEIDSPVGSSVVYAGTHVGFVIALDARDAQVDVRVVRVRGGRIAQVGDGGYSRDLVAHLVAHAGYRGAARRAIEPPAPVGDPLERQVDAAAGLLEHEGAALLADGPDALPGA